MNFYQILAAVPANQLRDLQLMLMAACATVYNGQTIPELQALAKGVTASAHRAALALSSECVPFLVKIISGKAYDEQELAISMKEIRQGIRYEIKTDRTLDYESIDTLKCTTAYLINYNDQALKKVQQMAPRFNEPRLTQNLLSDVGSQAEFRKPLEKIVKLVTGQPGAVLTAAQVAMLKAKKPEAHREYLRLRKNFNEVWKTELRNFVFASGKKAVDYQKLLKNFADKKIECPLTSGFKGFIDANGKLYTVKGKAINGVPGPGFTVQMNPEYDPVKDDQYVFTTYNAEGKISQYVYTTSYKKQATSEKFDKVSKLIGKIDGMHAKWIAAMKNQDMSLTCVAYTCLDFLYTFSARIGSKGNMADGVPTFGAGTILGRNVKILPNKIIVAYKGKAGTSYKHIVDPSAGPEAKLLFQNMKRIAAGGAPNEPFWKYEENGKVKYLLPLQVNNHFRRSGAPPEVTVHKIRHVKGTVLFKKVLAQNEDKIFNPKKPLTQAQADQMLMKVATMVGQMLGHVRGVGAQEKPTGATALANYIDPGVVLEYYERLNLRLPRALAKKLS